LNLEFAINWLLCVCNPSSSECGEWRSRRSTGTIHAHPSSLSEQNARVESTVIDNRRDEKSETADLVCQTSFSLDPILSLDTRYTLCVEGDESRKIMRLLSEIIPEVLPMLESNGEYFLFPVALTEVGKC
jgi:hypothetical protein